MSKIVNQKDMQTFIVIHGDYCYINYFINIILLSLLNIIYYKKHDINILEQNNYLDPSQ